MSKKLLFALVLLSVATTRPRANAWNDSSRMATIQAIVEQHTLRIDDTVFSDTGDRLFIDGHYYSDKPPITSVLGAVAYAPLYSFGIELGRGWNLAYYLITLLTVKVFWLLGLIAFHGALGRCRLSEKDRVWLTLALGVGSLYFSWSSTFNNHLLAAACLAIGFCALLRTTPESASRRDLFHAGLFLSLAAAFDPPTAVFFVGFAANLVASPGARRRNLPFFLLPLLLTAGVSMLLNVAVSGSVVPATTVTAHWDYPGSAWVKTGGIPAGTAMNPVPVAARYAFTALFGRAGFLVYNPLLLVALFFLAREVWQRREFAREALVVGGGMLVLMAYYFFATSNFGGWSYSFRWFVPALPLLFFFLHPFFPEAGRGLRRGFAALCGVAVVVAAIGVVNPWSYLVLDETPLVANVLQLSRLVRSR